jgi:hypothetical protein
MNKSCVYTGTDTRLRAQKAASPFDFSDAVDLDMSLNAPAPSVDSTIRLAGSDLINDIDHVYDSPRTELMAVQDLDRIQSKYIFKRAQNSMNTAHSLDQSSVHSFGDAPLPNYDKHLFAVPSLEIAREMVALYFKFEVVSNSILHRPTIQSWTEDIFGNFNSVRYDIEESNKKAILLMVIALSYAYTNNDPDDR